MFLDSGAVSNMIVCSEIREIPPGLLQHVLTVLVCCFYPCFHLGLGASDCSSGLAFGFTSPWTLLGSAARSSPTTRAKTGRTAHVLQLFENQTCTKLWLPFRVAFAPLFPKGILPFSGTGKRPVSMGSHTISTESPV